MDHNYAQHAKSALAGQKRPENVLLRKGKYHILLIKYFKGRLCMSGLILLAL